MDKKQKRILMVDDNVAVLESIKLYLGKRFNLAPATNGLAALNILYQQKVDLVILDLNLSVIDGETLVEIMEKNSQWKKIPVLIISGYGIKNKSWPENVKGFIGKPIPKEELLFNVNRILFS